MSQTKRRAITLAEMNECRSKLISPEEFLAGLRFVPKPDDIIISPYAKCGTTWTQQIVHTLRTRGDMDFEDISCVVPWIETSVPLQIDLNAPQKARPRAFKSHLNWDLVPKGARYIVPLRDPRDAIVSMFKFMEGWFLEPGTVDVNEFAMAELQDIENGRDYYSHLLSWWPRRDDEDALILSYEAMLIDPQHTIKRIADFISVPLDDELLKLTLKHSSIDFMLAHKNQFDDVPMRRLSEERSDLPTGSDSAKVRQGKTGSHRLELNEDVMAEMDIIWGRKIEPVTGHADYHQMVSALK